MMELLLQLRFGNGLLNYSSIFFALESWQAKSFIPELPHQEAICWLGKELQSNLAIKNFLAISNLFTNANLFTII